MEHQCLHLIIAPLLQQPKCELTPHEHSMYIRFLCLKLSEMFVFSTALKLFGAQICAAEIPQDPEI